MTDRRAPPSPGTIGLEPAPSTAPEGDPVPSGRQVIHRVITATGDWQLQQRGGHYELICSGVFLMASYNRDSDRALATMALGRIVGERLRVLVGGLGVGFTAQAALEDDRVRELDVVEVEPVVIEWHRRYFSTLCAAPLDDPRTRVHEDDLFDLSLPPRSYDAILLDTDNGPDWLARPNNARLYQHAAVVRFLDALTDKGVLAVWSANPAPAFAKLLAQKGRQVEAIETTDAVGPDRDHPAWVYLVQSRHAE